MTKKKWSKPKLIVYVRNKPEEVVLEICKYAAIVGPTGIYPQCSVSCPAGALCSDVGDT
jgi:hypothetical protein